MKLTDVTIKGTETKSYFITFEESLALKRNGYNIDPEDYLFYKDSILEVDDPLGLFLLLKYQGKLLPDKTSGIDDKLTRAINKIFYDLIKLEKYPFDEKVRMLEKVLLPNKMNLHKVDIMRIVSNIVEKKVSYLDNRTDTAIAWAKHYVENNGDISKRPIRIQKDLVFMEA